MDDDRNGREIEPMASIRKAREDIPEFIDIEICGIPYEPIELDEEAVCKKPCGYWWRSSWGIYLDY